MPPVADHRNARDERVSTHPDNHDRRHRRRSLILVALLLLSLLGTVGYLLDLELTPRDLDRDS